MISVAKWIAKNIILKIRYWEYDDKCSHTCLYQSLYMYINNSIIYFIKKTSIYQPNSTD